MRGTLWSRFALIIVFCTKFGKLILRKIIAGFKGLLLREGRMGMKGKGERGRKSRVKERRKWREGEKRGREEKGKERGKGCAMAVGEMDAPDPDCNRYHGTEIFNSECTRNCYQPGSTRSPGPAGVAQWLTVFPQTHSWTGEGPRRWVVRGEEGREEGEEGQ